MGLIMLFTIMIGMLFGIAVVIYRDHIDQLCEDHGLLGNILCTILGVILMGTIALLGSLILCLLGTMVYLLCVW